MNLPEPYPLPFMTLVSDIEKGVIKIPQFQRDFIWSKKMSCKLMDSIVKGYPIGTFIFRILGTQSLSKNSFSIFEQAKFLFIKNIKSSLSFNLSLRLEVSVLSSLSLLLSSTGYGLLPLSSTQALLSLILSEGIG
jgi:uncharacterized membrane protein